MNGPNLQKIKRRLNKSGIRGIALDIDDTLAFTSGYWVEQLEQRFGNPEKITPREALRKYGYVQNVAHWKTEEAFAWIEKARSSNEIQEILPLIENSNHFVNKINKFIPVACYITVRPETVVSGTQKWLDKHAFPKAEIIARPEKFNYEQGTKWKAGVLAKLYPEALGIVDDNPFIADNLPNDYKGTVFVYEREFLYTGKLNVVACRNWKDVLSGIEKLISK